MKKRAKIFNRIDSYIGLLMVGAFVVSVPSISLAETIINNSVTTEANTGGENNGNGKASASVKIKTEVDGEVVIDIDESKESTDGSRVIIEKEVRYVSSDSENNVEVQTVVNKESSFEQESQIESQGVIEVIIGESEIGEDESENDSKLINDKPIISFFNSIKKFFTAYVFWWN